MRDSSFRASRRLSAALGLAILAACPIDASGQLAIGLGGPLGDTGRAIAVDASGNIAVTGSFNGTVDFDPGPGLLELTAGGSEAVFVASFDPAGALRFARAFPGDGYGIAVDSAGNVYVTGEIQGAPVDVDPGPDSVLLDPQQGRAFLVSYDGTGALRFGLNFGGGLSNRVERGTAIAVDENDHVYLTGIINGDTDFDGPGGELPVPLNGLTDGFVASYSTNGGYRFGFAVGSTLADAGYGIAARGNECCVTGAFRGTVDFDPAAEIETRTSNGNLDLFVARYSSTGALLSVAAVGGPFDDIGYALALDAAGNVFATGEFRDTVDFDPGPGQSLVTSAGNRDLFLASYTAAGDLRFAFGLGNTNDMVGLGLAVDVGGEPWITGRFTGTVDFDPGPGDASITGNQEAFVAGYSGAGTFRLAHRFPDVGSLDSDSGEGIALDVGGSVHVVGTFAGTNDFDPGPASLELTSNGASDVFFLRETATAVAVGEVPASREDSRLGPIAPNPSGGDTRLEWTARASGPVRVTLHDVTGRRLAVLWSGVLAAGERKALSLSGSGLASGSYFVRVEDRGGVSSGNFVVVR
ncbi:MAG: SBBP repeat-containing protein [bacterium]